MVNALSIYKLRMINVERCRDVHYVPQLSKFADVAFNYTLLHRAGERIPTFKSYMFAYRATTRSAGGAAAGRRLVAHRVQRADLLEHGTRLDSMRA
eukprot:SAG11_NODE_10233_length_845_cov_1.037534_2_plen_95_part_01